MFYVNHIGDTEVSYVIITSMNGSRKLVVIGLLGSKLDSGLHEGRWAKWRPTVATCQHEELLINRLELLHAPREGKLSKQVQSDIESVSPETEVRCHELEFDAPWEFESVYDTLHRFSLNYNFQTEQEDYLVHITTGTHVQQICLFLLTESRHLPARLLQSSPPSRSNNSGEGAYQLIDLDLSKYDALATRFEQEQRESLSFLKSGIETRNKTFNALIEQIERVAISSRAPMLITGSTGAGKSQLVKRIFDLKRKREQVSGEFVEVNCATLRGDQAMSTLFGHIKGAYTGATGARPGLLTSADKGVLFLDEIGELGLDEQAMLLRAIEEKRFLPVGADKESRSDFQLIAGTNRDLQESVSEGSFREDLLARINLWTFRLPGLAERREDIEPNIDYELNRFTTETGRRVTINKEARQLFLKFANSASALWTANFRDLNATIIRMATLASNGRITRNEVDEEILRLKASWGTDSRLRSSLAAILDESEINKIDLFDQGQLEFVIGTCRMCQSISEAGRKLFSVSREAKKQTNDADRLRKYLARFGISWGDIQ